MVHPWHTQIRPIAETRRLRKDREETTSACLPQDGLKSPFRHRTEGINNDEKSESRETSSYCLHSATAGEQEDNLVFARWVLGEYSCDWPCNIDYVSSRPRIPDAVATALLLPIVTRAASATSHINTFKSIILTETTRTTIHLILRWCVWITTPHDVLLQPPLCCGNRRSWEMCCGAATGAAGCVLFLAAGTATTSGISSMTFV
jgi:hypothetical protein